MTDIKHTPGPWIVDRHPFVSTQDGEIIAKVRAPWNGEATEENEEANRRLIAAAPELLEACRMALTSLTEIAEDHGINHIAKGKRRGCFASA